MLFLQKFLTVLMLFFPAAYGLATPEQALGGRVTGFTGPADVELTGDYLTATFCYCQYPPKVQEVMGLAHYYQIEYYNSHLNTTFILADSCPRDEMDYDISCVPDHGGDKVLAGETIYWEGICKTWKGIRDVSDKEKVHDEKLCYRAERHHGHDYIYFNKQKRDLSKAGNQVPVWQKQTESDATCEVMCRENLDAALLTDSHPPSHQVTWNDIDDMCDHCA